MDLDPSVREGGVERKVIDLPGGEIDAGGEGDGQADSA